ncbi:GalNAc(5)-diNAcBac-PP-undecaprenol beta-1,3-glucosyltransferase [Marinomonas spartinae]|uniref:GalNAc(5)-diNAcBac-PP-undecaprenol beta-1,3-glucosyltransferase n=2 Tax=Marinomonas spartinae TaxID=1792290 RepID=A0A1A8TN20_9GAMM|nr:GalNAc(5)-diNAcBac-PP-undecaprenol beta-1,3-glucosyltransferase [Marinomonas spartinae]SBS37877.1 GalNAc(5)-diNAcBac-PP-undecaprenol beta-1,3-glucosyltransferase [Marinomonas spartinae]
MVNMTPFIGNERGKQMNKLSVIIITYNEQKRIGQLLEDLNNQVFKDFEVIVVDSNSDDDTLLVAAQYETCFDEFRVHKMEKRGVSLGRNVGANLAKYERILFLDADVRLHERFLSKAIKKLDKSKLEIAGVYMGASRLGLPTKLSYGMFNVGIYLTQFFFPTAVGACIFSTKRLHRELGGFNERINLCEDCDYVNRASKTWRFRMLAMTFQFDPRRLKQDGVLKMGYLYIRANVRRFFIGEMYNNEIEYKFGHYHENN